MICLQCKSWVAEKIAIAVCAICVIDCRKLSKLFSLTGKHPRLLNLMNQFSHYPDKRLLKLLRAGDKTAFEEIYNRYWSRLYSTAFKRTHNREIAEELVQDVFSGLWQHNGTPIDNLWAYLQTAIKYRVINYHHREMTRRAYLQKLKTESSLENLTEEHVLLDDLSEALEKEINKMPEKRQLIYKMHRQENLTMREVASRLGISEKTVENQLGKALKILKLNLRHFLVWILFTLFN